MHFEMNPNVGVAESSPLCEWHFSCVIAPILRLFKFLSFLCASSKRKCLSSVIMSFLIAGPVCTAAGEWELIRSAVSLINGIYIAKSTFSFLQNSSARQYR